MLFFLTEKVRNFDMRLLFEILTFTHFIKLVAFICHRLTSVTAPLLGGASAPFLQRQTLYLDFTYNFPKLLQKSEKGD